MTFPDSAEPIFNESACLSFPRLFYGNPTTLVPVFADSGPSNSVSFPTRMTDAQVTAQDASINPRQSVLGTTVYGIDYLNNVVASGHAPIPANTVVNMANIQQLSGFTPDQFLQPPPMPRSRIWPVQIQLGHVPGRLLVLGSFRKSNDDRRYLRNSRSSSHQRGPELQSAVHAQLPRRATAGNRRGHGVDLRLLPQGHQRHHRPFAPQSWPSKRACHGFGKRTGARNGSETNRKLWAMGLGNLRRIYDRLPEKRMSHRFTVQGQLHLRACHRRRSEFHSDLRNSEPAKASTSLRSADSPTVSSVKCRW